MSRYCVVNFLLLLLLLISGCTSTKKITYLQTDKLKEGKAINLKTYYQENIIRFQPDDILGITVNVPTEQSIAYDFNLPVQPSATTENSLTGEMRNGVGRQTYQVNKEGEINFPVLGMIKVSGYTKQELENHLKDLLVKYLKTDPIVVVTLANFKIWVLGEVGKPGQYSVSRNQINILEAIALAGDLNIYGRRDNVKLVRQAPDGELRIIQLNINKADIVSSPYFYLTQNDLIYIEPNQSRANSASSTSRNLILTLLSTAMSTVSFILLLTK